MEFRSCKGHFMPEATVETPLQLIRLLIQAHLVDQRTIFLLSHYTGRKALNNIFLGILQQKFQRTSFWVGFQQVFSMFFNESWRECCPMIRQKTVSRNFYFLLLSNCYFSVENACFNKFTSLTCVKTNPTSNQDFLTWFFREKCQEDIAMLIMSSHSNLTGNKLD